MFANKLTDEEKKVQFLCTINSLIDKKIIYTTCLQCNKLIVTKLKLKEIKNGLAQKNSGDAWLIVIIE